MVLRKKKNKCICTFELNLLTLDFCLSWTNIFRNSFHCFLSILFLTIQNAVILWMHDPPRRDAVIVKQALNPDIVDLEAATEIICSRTPSQIQHFKQIYYSTFGVHLERDIEIYTSGDLKKVSSLCFSIKFSLTYNRRLVLEIWHLQNMEYILSIFVEYSMQCSAICM